MQKSKDLIHGFGYYDRYTENELDLQFQKYVIDFLKGKHGKVEFPLSTEDLTLIIENDVESLDLYAELEPDVEGETSFSKNSKPIVRISKELTESANQENRLRMTLAHEYGHVRLHNFVVQIKGKYSQKCKRDGINSGGLLDWMEWQAFYAGSALLMPVFELKNIISSLSLSSSNSAQITKAVSDRFKVSAKAAEIRLKQKRIIK